MGYVLVTADFPDVSTSERESIYECLEEKRWKKITEFGRDITTVWEGHSKTLSEKDFIQLAIKHFTECSDPYCEPKLVIHYGENKPTRHGLV